MPRPYRNGYHHPVVAAAFRLRDTPRDLKVAAVELHKTEMPSRPKGRMAFPVYPSLETASRSFPRPVCPQDFRSGSKP
jgi:hypothetical protein